MGTTFRVLPVFADPQVIDVGDVVIAVPCIDQRRDSDGLWTVFRMAEAAMPLRIVQRLEHHDPAGVKRFDQFEGPLDRGDGIVQRRPGLLVVGLDGWPILGEGQPGTDEGVHVAVGDVVDDLADGPASVAVGGIELFMVQALNGITQVVGQFGEGRHRVGEVILADSLRSDTGREMELTDGVA
jgi:hypothetical protein